MLGAYHDSNGQLAVHRWQWKRLGFSEFWLRLAGVRRCLQLVRSSRTSIASFSLLRTFQKQVSTKISVLESSIF